MKTFKELGLSDELVEQIHEMKIYKPTEIQEKTIPLLLEGKDLIGQAQTGTGKTLAFGSVLMNKINEEHKLPESLILVPTRELALQVQAVLQQLIGKRKISVVSVYGGAEIETQIRLLKKGCQIVVGTPGRVQDLLKRKSLKLNMIHTMILDEADEMLNMGFKEDIENILQYAPQEKQIAMFSATMPKGIKNIVHEYLKEDYIHIQMKSKNLVTDNISQYYIDVKPHHKLEILCRILDSREISSAIIFCKTKRSVDELAIELNKRNYSVLSMHGDLTQTQRLETLNRFKKGTVKILVASDVAARGIDIETMSHVINYEMPSDDEFYIHRIGRCGRASKKGEAISLVTRSEKDDLLKIVKAHHTTIKKIQPPRQKEIFDYQMKQLFNQIEDTIQNKDLKIYYNLAKNMNPKIKNEVIASLLALSYEKQIGYPYKDDIESDVFLPIVINCGSIDKVTNNDLKTFILDHAQIKHHQIDRIEISRKSSLVYVHEDVVERVVNTCNNKRFKQRKTEVRVIR